MVVEKLSGKDDALTACRPVNLHQLSWAAEAGSTCADMTFTVDGFGAHAAVNSTRFSSAGIDGCGCCTSRCCPQFFGRRFGRIGGAGKGEFLRGGCCAHVGRNRATQHHDQRGTEGRHDSAAAAE